jgi:hypothetical protein
MTRTCTGFVSGSVFGVLLLALLMLTDNDGNKAHAQFGCYTLMNVTCANLLGGGAYRCTDQQCQVYNGNVIACPSNTPDQVIANGNSVPQCTGTTFLGQTVCNVGAGAETNCGGDYPCTGCAPNSKMQLVCQADGPMEFIWEADTLGGALCPPFGG